ncbi:hydrogenase expression/formation protein HypE [Dulcicalothrix desertica PCC 7102]|uniref:Hydrogenase expression/formation protein HypE n=1 Tax=Dulcicalothrix desertica PCC 7102 TaxID=232991 RepID=A0A3S1AKY8_9CYAN|nr:hydrogenase expression/formation protein HypE [Dulcicalothrix desertica]RUT03213.1 hydrogenase expression/formation protein HypE [Dulcicalothrix desertica PCC 7102]TWH53583.1 hydrogenase expression/formation protein HypE [Dulcicalothrix desertica PCC 7102]
MKNSDYGIKLNKRAQLRDKNITLAHGSGGKAMHDLIDDIFVNTFNNSYLAPLEDQATFEIAALMQHGDKLAFTTDSYVVDPLFFPGSDIGELAVNGTVNDLAVSGAKPLYLTCSVILEEGFPVETLRRIVKSMQNAAIKAGVQIVTGDTKVVPKGAADKIFINTTGIGVISNKVNISTQNIRPGDVVLINGELGNHGTSILIARGELALDSNIESDCQPLNDLVATIIEACPDIHAMRDVTRGGLATVLNEFASSANVSIRLDEAAIPVQEQVKGVCEILGFDPLYLANEGKLVVVLKREDADTVLSAMKSHPAGLNACVVGEVIEKPEGIVLLKTGFGAERIVDMLVGDQLPRIC